MEGNVLTRTY